MSEAYLWHDFGIYHSEKPNIIYGLSKKDNTDLKLLKI